MMKLHSMKIANSTERSTALWVLSEKIFLFMIAYVAVTRVWLAFSDPYYSPVFYILSQSMNYLCVIAGGILIIKYGRAMKINSTKFKLIVLSSVYFLLCTFYTVSGENIITSFFAFITCLIYALLTDKMQIRIFDIFYKIILYSSIFSCILYIMYVLGMRMGFEIVPYYKGAVTYAHYVKWFVFAMYESKTELRLCGLFNEPGGLGTVCALLFAARYDYSKKWEKGVLLLAVALSFSLAGFLLLFIFVTCKFISENKKNIVLLIVFALLFLILPYIDFGNDRMNAFFDRIAITSTGLAGDNRTKEWFDAPYEQFLTTNDKWFGRGEGYHFEEDLGGNLSYKTYVIQFGLMGYGLWLMGWLHCALKLSKNNKKCLPYILIFFISLYQRPSPITGLYGFVMLFGGIKWMQVKSRLKANPALMTIPGNFLANDKISNEVQTR